MLLLLLLAGGSLLLLLFGLLLLRDGLLLGVGETLAGLDPDAVELGDAAAGVLEAVPRGLEDLLARVRAALVRVAWKMVFLSLT